VTFFIAAFAVTTKSREEICADRIPKANERRVTEIYQTFLPKIPNNGMRPFLIDVTNMLWLDEHFANLLLFAGMP
jgi:hypothetical protein